MNAFKLALLTALLLAPLAVLRAALATDHPFHPRRRHQVAHVTRVDEDFSREDLAR